MSYLLFCFLIFSAFSLFAETDSADAIENVVPLESPTATSNSVPQASEVSVPEASASTAVVPTPAPENDGISVGKVLSLGARVDAIYTGGGVVAQGFSIPSLRISASGEAGNYIDYRISAAQTREFSSALLAQLIPSEAFVDLSTNPLRNGLRRDGSDIRLRMGMCAPLFNPWWTPDLSNLNIPDYSEVHRANFISRDIGLEVAVRPFGEKLLLAAGAFNGSGITALNTNNSKAFTGHFQLTIPISSLEISLGNGSLYSEQSSRGSINFKRNWVSDFFISFALKKANTAFMIDTFFSQYEDPSRLLSPNGYSVIGTFGLNDWVGAFTRYEFSTDSPQKGKIQAFQLGPMLTLSNYAKAFAIYQAVLSSGLEERSVFLRVRVSI